jgi:hypothetical protein
MDIATPGAGVLTPALRHRDTDRGGPHPALVVSPYPAPAALTRARGIAISGEAAISRPSGIAVPILAFSSLGRRQAREPNARAIAVVHPAHHDVVLEHPGFFILAKQWEQAGHAG